MHVATSVNIVHAAGWGRPMNHLHARARGRGAGRVGSLAQRVACASSLCRGVPPQPGGVRVGDLGGERERGGVRAPQQQTQPFGTTNATAAAAAAAAATKTKKQQQKHNHHHHRATGLRAHGVVHPEELSRLDRRRQVRDRHLDRGGVRRQLRTTRKGTVLGTKAVETH